MRQYAISPRLTRYNVASAAFSRDGKRALLGGSDGTTRLWDLVGGRELALMVASPDDEQLTVTPRGFFASSRRDTSLVAIARGLEAVTIGQVHQSLFNPDLVREALAGDPNGEVKRASEVISLDRVLDSGPAPEVEIISQPAATKSDSDLVTVAARITDRGKGVGRIEWRDNGITVGVSNALENAGGIQEVRQDLALDPGDNSIEVVAYNARNLLASLPARTAIAYTGAADTIKPKLHILAIGINKYVDQGWTPPGGSEVEAFPQLGLAVGDAQSFAAEINKAAAGFYSEVKVRSVLDTEATLAGLDRIVAEMAAGISPRDTFVFYAAAHGYSSSGRFYLIPQDYQGGPNPEALASRAISQERLQDWIAGKIKAKKAVVLLDTCESGALTNGYAHNRLDAPASEAGVGRLHEATGRPVLTAAAAGKPAFEGYQGHGVFTWALIDALHHGDTNGNGAIELSELVAHVQDEVPKISAALNGRGFARAATDNTQSAHFGATGGDFSLANRLP